MRWLFGLYLLIISLAIHGCSAKLILVPPEIDLTRYERIGLIDFSSNIRGSASELITQKFLQEIRLSQGGLRIVEIGSSGIPETIQEVGMNPETVRAIGEKYKVNVIFMGDLSISDIKPRINVVRNPGDYFSGHQVNLSGKSMSIISDVELTMTAKLLETQNGAMVWVDSTQGTTGVANVRMFKRHVTPTSKLLRGVSFEEVNPKNEYQKLVDSLTKEIAADFRASYKRSR